MFKLRAFWLLIALFWAISSVNHSKGAILPKIDVDGRIEIVGDYTDGQEFEIVLRFTLRPTGWAYENYQQHLQELEKRAEQGDSTSINQLNYYKGMVDAAYIIFEDNIEFLSDRVWIGNMEPNVENFYTIKARLKEEKQTYITLSVVYRCPTEPSNLNQTGIGFATSTADGLTLFPGVSGKASTKEIDIGGATIRTIVNPSGPFPDSLPEIQETGPAEKSPRSIISNPHFPAGGLMRFLPKSSAGHGNG